MLILGQNGLAPDRQRPPRPAAAVALAVPARCTRVQPCSPWLSSGLSHCSFGVRSLPPLQLAKLQQASAHFHTCLGGGSVASPDRAASFRSPAPAAGAVRASQRAPPRCGAAGWYKPLRADTPYRHQNWCRIDHTWPPIIHASNSAQSSVSTCGVEPSAVRGPCARRRSAGETPETPRTPFS
jgi:hypothetical protein